MLFASEAPTETIGFLEFEAFLRAGEFQTQLRDVASEKVSEAIPILQNPSEKQSQASAFPLGISSKMPQPALSQRVSLDVPCW